MMIKKTAFVTCSLLFFAACASKSPVTDVKKESQVAQKEVKKTDIAIEKKIKEKVKITSIQKNVSKNEPLAVVRNYTQQLKGLVDLPQGNARQKTIAEQVRSYFDFPELAKRSLGKHWKTQSRANQKKYSDLFIELVETSYLKRSKQIIGEYNVTFKNQKITGKTAKVTSTVSQEDADIDIYYDLLKKNNQWVIYNITLDDVNLIRTYQTQFNKIVSTKGFPHLLNLMKKRLKTREDDVNL